MTVRRHRNYVLAVLFVVFVLNSVDSVALGLVLQEIKVDLLLSDAQLGVLTGIAFALLYAIAGLTIAKWADCGDRVAIVSIATALWSVLVAACGSAASFVQLLLLRVGVGIGEAGCWPASQSLIADYFDRADRPRANAVCLMAAGVSAVVGYGVAGWLNERFGWRMMFVMLGMPGLAVAALAWFTLRDPRLETQQSGESSRGFSRASRSLQKITARASPQPRLMEVGAILWSNTTLRRALLFWSFSTFCATALAQWQPAFFVRSHGMKTEEVGFWFALEYGLGSTVGPFLGGAWASRYAANNERLQFRVAAVTYCVLMVLSAFMYLASNVYCALGLLAVYALVVNAFAAPLWGMIQTLVPENMRAAAAAILMLLGSLIGNGLGSFAAGALSDMFQPRFGEDSLRYALLVLCPGFLWAAWHLWKAGGSVKRDMATAAREERDARCSDQYTVSAVSRR
jgi:MFS family permease